MKVDKMLPKVYYKESRDFSYIGRIFEVGLNYMKTCADLVREDPDSDQVNPMIVDLLATSLGFESKHQYQTKDLIAIASTLIEILRYKGTMESIEKVIETLSASQEVSDEMDISIDPTDPNTISLVIPPTMKDIILAEDLFDYILPVGTCITVARASNLTLPVEMIDSSDNIPEIVKISNKTLSYIFSNDSRLIEEGNPTVPIVTIPTTTEGVNQTFESIEAPVDVSEEGAQKPSLTYFGAVYTPATDDEERSYPKKEN